MSVYLTPGQVGQTEYDFIQSDEQTQPLAIEDRAAQYLEQQVAQTQSWWDAQPEYKRKAIISGATSAVVFYWLSRILGSFFGKGK